MLHAHQIYWSKRSMPLAVCQQEVKRMIHKIVELVKAEKPLLLVVDPSLVVAQILNVTLRRAGCEVEMVSFQQTEAAIFWLSGEMDRTKAAKRPLATPWDSYPDVRPPTIVIVSLSFSPDEREEVLYRVSCLSRTIKIITTSTKEELLDQDNDWRERYWTRVVSHLPQPITVEDVIERVVTVLYP
jgi:hypothetical protein